MDKAIKKQQEEAEAAKQWFQEQSRAEPHDESSTDDTANV